MSGTFAFINWTDRTKFLEQPVDFGSGLNSIGTTQLLSVPLALESAHAATATNGMPGGNNGSTLRNDGTNWLANSNLFNDGTNVGIGTTSPDNKLEIDITSFSNEPQFSIHNNEYYLTAMKFQAPIQEWWMGQNHSPGGGTFNDYFIHNADDNSDYFILKTISRLGLGPDNQPVAMLDVDGDMKLGSEGTVIDNIIKATVTVDLPGISAGGASVQTLPVPNASPGATAFMSPENNFATALIISFVRVSAEGNVTIKFYNASGTAIDQAETDFYITVIE